jgi:hypothetical protein
VPLKVPFCGSAAAIKPMRCCAHPVRANLSAAFGALCFGCGSIIAFIMTRNKYRNEMIKRGVARYNQQTGKWEW